MEVSHRKEAGKVATFPALYSLTATLLHNAAAVISAGAANAIIVTTHRLDNASRMRCTIDRACATASDARTAQSKKQNQP